MASPSRTDPCIGPIDHVRTPSNRGSIRISRTSRSVRAVLAQRGRSTAHLPRTRIRAIAGRGRVSWSSRSRHGRSGETARRRARPATVPGFRMVNSREEKTTLITCCGNADSPRSHNADNSPTGRIDQRESEEFRIGGGQPPTGRSWQHPRQPGRRAAHNRCYRRTHRSDGVASSCAYVRHGHRPDRRGRCGCRRPGIRGALATKIISALRSIPETGRCLGGKVVSAWCGPGSGAGCEVVAPTPGSPDRPTRGPSQT